MDGRGQWWYIIAVFNEPPKKEIAQCKIWRTGWPNEKVLDTSKRSTQKAFSCCNAIFETGPTAMQ
jgi:hypothetical protein